MHLSEPHTGHVGRECVSLCANRRRPIKACDPNPTALLLDAPGVFALYQPGNIRASLDPFCHKTLQTAGPHLAGVAYRASGARLRSMDQRATVRAYILHRSYVTFRCLRRQNRSGLLDRCGDPGGRVQLALQPHYTSCGQGPDLLVTLYVLTKPARHNPLSDRRQHAHERHGTAKQCVTSCASSWCSGALALHTMRGCASGYEAYIP